DFHSGNILIDENGGPMITDFGLSRVEDMKKRASGTSQVFGLMAYTAPERLENSKYPFDERCDIYSLGVIFWEITAERRPFNGQNDISLALNLMKGKREKFPESTPPKFAELAMSCWDEDPEKRPSLSQIKQTLNEILDDLSKSENNNSNLNNLKKDDTLGDTNDCEVYYSAELDSSNYITALYDIPFDHLTVDDI
ncbi:2779_t:CDS:2, partial [Ambispora leptoticha]